MQIFTENENQSKLKRSGDSSFFVCFTKNAGKKFSQFLMKYIQLT